MRRVSAYNYNTPTALNLVIEPPLARDLHGIPLHHPRPSPRHLDSHTEVFDADSGTITIPRYAVHEWRRAEAEGEESVVEEWTEPDDGEKEVFFRNLSGVVEDEGRRVSGWMLEWKLWVVFWRHDNWPVLWGRSWAARWVVTHAVLGAVVLLGWCMGWRGRYPEYTPRKVRSD